MARHVLYGEYGQSKKVVSAGDSPEFMFIVLDGEVQLEVRREKELLRGAEYRWTAKAMNSCKLLKVPREAMLTLFGGAEGLFFTRISKFLTLEVKAFTAFMRDNCGGGGVGGGVDGSVHDHLYVGSDADSNDGNGDDVTTS
eukprot:gene4301-5297_t